MSCDHELANEKTRCSGKNASYITICLIIWLAPRAARWTKSRAVIGYPSGQDGAILPARDYPLYPASKFHQKPYNKSFIDQVCSVKMAGYWPSSFFACLWTERKSRSINSHKKRTRPISSHLDRTNLVNKGFIIWLLEKFACGIQRVVSSGEDGSILPARVANHSARFGSSCPLAELAI